MGSQLMIIFIIYTGFTKFMIHSSYIYVFETLLYTLSYAMIKKYTHTGH